MYSIKFLMKFFLLFGCTNYGISQDLINNCALDIEENQAVTIGTIVTNPNSSVTITNQYMIPIEKMQECVDQLKRLEQIKKEIELSKIEIKDQKSLLLHEQKIIQDQTKALNKNKKYISAEKKNLELIKEDFNRQIDETINEFNRYIKIIETSNAQGKFQEVYYRMQEIKVKGESIIQSQKCMIEDFDIYEIEDDKGNIKYGFSIEQFRNDPTYILIGEFHEGLARVKRFNKYGFIDRTGKVIIDYKYDYVIDFKNQKSLVWNNGELFFIDNYGNTLNKVELPPDFKSFISARHLMNSDYIVITYNVSIAIPYYSGEPSYISYKQRNYKANVLITLKGEPVPIEICQFFEEYYSKPDCKYCIIEELSDYNQSDQARIGLINLVFEKRDGYFKSLKETESTEYIVINKDFKRVFSAPFIDAFSDNVYLAIYNKDNIPIQKVKYFTPNGSSLPFEYSYGEYFQNGLAIIGKFDVKKGSIKYGVTNKNGLEIIPPIFDSIEKSTSDIFFAQIQGHIFQINNKGKCVSNYSVYKEILRDFYQKSENIK